MRSDLRIYLAADYGRRSEMVEYAAALELRGHNISAQWLLKNTDTSKPDVTDAQRIEWARMELDDICTNSDVFILFTTGELCRGGRQIEYGHALGVVDEIYIVGPPEVLFHYLATARFDTFQDLLDGGVL